VPVPHLDVDPAALVIGRKQLRRLLATAFPPEDRGATAGAPLGCSGCARAHANPFTGERRFGAVCSPEIDQMFYFCADSTCHFGACQGKTRGKSCKDDRPYGSAGNRTSRISSQLPG